MRLTEGFGKRNRHSKTAERATAPLLLVVAMVLAGGASPMLPALDPQALMAQVDSDPEQARQKLLPYAKPGALASPRDGMMALSMIARTYEMQRRYGEAISYAQRHYALPQKQRDVRGMAQAMNDLGAYARPLGNLDVAVRNLKGAASLAARVKDAASWGEALFNLSVLMLNFGDYENALAASLESQRVMEPHGVRPYPVSSSGVSKLLIERDYHEQIVQLAKLEGRTSDVMSETAVVSEIDRKISSAREASRAAVAAAQIRTEGKDLSIALIEARNANLRLRERERQVWLIAGLTSLMVLLAGLFTWYRARQLRLRQEQRHEERSRIARDLHDTLLQNMAGTQLQLQATAIQASREASPLVPRLETMVSQLGESMASARDAVWQIRSAMIERGELVEAITEWIEQTCQAKRAKVTFECDGAPAKVTPGQAEDLFRIAQEAVGNALRHADPRSIVVRLVRNAGKTELSISDDGRGFEPRPESAGYGGHWGLVGIRERAERLGASLSVVSAPETGTWISVKLAD